MDPCISSEDAPSWRLWIWEGRPLSQLYWDPGEWQWPHSDPSCAPVSVFECSVKICRLSLIRQQTEQLTQLRVWLHEGLSHAYLRHFWTTLWDLHMARCISFFVWLTTHAGLVKVPAEIECTGVSKKKRKGCTANTSKGGRERKGGDGRR